MKVDEMFSVDADLSPNEIKFKGATLNDVIVNRFNTEGFGGVDGVFGYAELQKDGTYSINTMSMSPMLIQKGAASCNVSPAGNISFGSEDLTANKAFVYVKWCETDLLETCFKEDYTWTPDGQLEIDQNVLDKVTDMVVDAVTEGMFLTLVNGGSHSKSDVKATDVSPEEIKLFSQTIDSHKGIIPTLKIAASNTPHLNVDGVFKASESTARKFNGSVVKSFDKLLDEAPTTLLQLITTNPSDVVISVDAVTYGRLRTEMGEQCKQPNGKCSDRITKVDGAFYIDDVVVRPIKEANFFDALTGTTSRYMTISKKEVLVLGGSVSLIGTGNKVGLKLTKNSPNGITSYHLIGNFLLLSHILDVNLVVSTQEKFKI